MEQELQDAPVPVPKPRKVGVEQATKAFKAMMLQKEVYDYAFKLKTKYPKMSDARIRRKTEEYFKRSMAEVRKT